jgi:hypothetical protein
MTGDWPTDANDGCPAPHGWGLVINAPPGVWMET